MQLNYLDYFTFREMLYLFLYSPYPYWIQFFINGRDKDKLSDMIYDITKIKPKKQSIKTSFENKTGSYIEIYTKSPTITCGKRAGIIIIDISYSLEEYYEIFRPMASLEPQRVYAFDMYNWDKKHEEGQKEIAYWLKVTGGQNEN